MVINNENKISKFFSKVYMWMFIGLLISGLTAYFTSKSLVMLKFVLNYYIFIIVAELIVVIIFSSLRQKASPQLAKILFIIYSVLSGITLSSIFIVYKLDGIIMVFLAASLMFALLAIYGFVTKQNLSSFGKILIFGLISVVIMSIINIFVKNSSFDIFLSIISVVIFLGLTAYDMNRLKYIYEYYVNDDNMLEKASIYGALDLYLDFINIFIRLLELFGKRKD